MKKTAIIFLTSLLLIAAVYAVMGMFSRNVTGLATEVFYVLEKAEHNSGLPAVILGDSVCHQIWPPQKDSPNLSHLGCNQAITPAGTYLLLRKYLENNPQVKDVFYVILPNTLGNDLGLDFTYQYFVIPFLNPENMKLLDEATVQKLYSKFGKIFVTNAYVKTFLMNNNLFMKQYRNHIWLKKEKSYLHRISPTAGIYLAKMRTLCNERNIKLHILPLPMADAAKNYGWDDFRQDIKDYGFEDILGGYVDRIKYYPADWMIDGIHFKKDILKQHIDEIRAAVMNS